MLKLRAQNSLIPEVITNAYLNIGANNRELVLEGQYWRLITHQFVHLGLSHLFFNMYALVYIGLMVEHKLGSAKFLITYLLSGICGGLVSLIFHKYGFMAGASGAIMGVFGAFMALILSKAFEKNANKSLLISTILVTAIMLLNGINGKVDNSAHIGGLISGFVICYILFNEKLWRWKITTNWQYGLTCIVVLIFSAIILIFAPNYQNRKFYKLQFQFEQNSFDFNKVYSIPYDLSKAEKVKTIEQYGIRLWQKNKQIVAEMHKLNLEEKESYRRDFDGKITNLAIKISSLLRKEYLEESSKYRYEIEQLTNEVNNIRSEAGSSEYKW
ncbi:rhomboid family intramembrane serine protease [Pedobacter sp. P26]|uniref:rhomboid family intramembrane serine protease n=1 Tax=Pedobacter sp. P26 TaxID=3423956 RepID=UPI003D678ED4